MTTTTMTNPATHTPTFFEPSDYTVLEYLDNRKPAYYGQEPLDYAAEVADWEGTMRGALGDGWRQKAFRCVHCGNTNVRWITVVLHIPTADRVVFGCDCTVRLGFENLQAFKLAILQAKAEAGHAKMKIWVARCAFLDARPALAAAVEQAKQPAHAGNAFVQDVLKRLNDYGTLTDRQVTAVLTSLVRDLHVAAQKAVDDAEPKGAAPSGRQTVTGEVLSIKVQDSDYGVVRKMLVKLTNGSKVWVTAPDGVHAMQTIMFAATFSVSKDDPSFAFGSRPFLKQVAA